jgi:protease I
MARVAVILEAMFEDSEFRIPYDGLRRAGHDVVVIGVGARKHLEGKQGDETVVTELSIRDARAEGFDALVIPGGYSPDKLRLDRDMVAFTRDVFQAGKPVAAICHAGSLLIEAGVVRGRTLTSWPSIKTDLINAGARWVDRQVALDQNLITSRKPDDLERFTEAILRALEERGSEQAAPPAAAPARGAERKRKAAGSRRGGGE